MFSAHRFPIILCCAVVVIGAGGCNTLKKITSPPADGGSGGAGKPSGEKSMLLGMNYAEASAISPKKLEIPPFFKVAADEIEVVRKNKDGSPRTVRAKGKVFLQIDFSEPATALCQEAYFGDEEVILRGHPIVKRGSSLVEGLASSTVFYMYGTRLRAIGQHRLTNEGAVMASLPDDAKPGYRGGSWDGGPNPLLPPLSPSAVPENIRSEMQKAAEAEAVLQRSRLEPVLPLKEDAPVEKLTPLVVPPEPAAAKKEADAEKKAPEKSAKEAEKTPEKPKA